MKRFLLAVVLAAASLPALAQVGVSINVGAPDFYGQIFLGDAPRPQLIYAQPVVVAPAPQYVGVAPIYLHVPPGHARHWSKHCAAYRACGRPVYFVRDGWYRDQYVPYYREHHDKHFDKHWDRKKFKKHDKHDRGGKHGRHGRDDD